MRDWNALYEQARIDTGDDVGIVQFQRRGKGCLSYLVGSPEAGEAAVVDPTRHVEQYVVAAAEHDVEITHVLDTHVHADHVSGGRKLADLLACRTTSAHARRSATWRTSSTTSRTATSSASATGRYRCSTRRATRPRW
ncbi:MBL fold metallo-hydrolase [Halomicrococcus gelatinilyticus]|uniref:MBL fold metallo-hydrolase n=1 Tax=Halomicrococcus gelatinilyticus TaxID=1702103 RepID=UPI002E10CB3C